MSHCCGGCGGEDPAKKKEQTVDVEAKKTAGKDLAENTTAATGTWQPPKK